MIFLDLDDTLVHTVDFPPQNKENVFRIVLEEETYYSKKRECTEGFLCACRQIAKTYLLTNATRAYALSHNKTLQLGFEPSEIFAREDYLYESRVAYGTQTLLTCTKKFPEAILIDNLPATDPLAKAKQRFLGIPETQYLQIREFRGLKDPPCFQEETKTLLKTLQNHFHKK